MIGILLVNKPEGMTSHDVVYRVRKALGTKRVGHAGTLDPIATGLLVIAVGPATRFLQYLALEPKEYDCTFQFGSETNTYDKEGEIVASYDVPTNLGELIHGAMPQFRGTIQQTPPVFSAIKKNGKPLYSYARKGIEVTVEEREVTIHQFECLRYENGAGDFRILCSGGTYIRSLAHDLGKSVGCGAHVQELQRTRNGIFDIDDSVELEDISEGALIPLDKALHPMPMAQLNEGQLNRILHGQWVKVDENYGCNFVGLQSESGQVIGVAKVDGKLLHPQCLIATESLHEPV